MSYYEILEVLPSASSEVIKMAYKAISKQYHPDVFNGDKQFAEEHMKKINIAYDTLSNPEKRKAYDNELKRQDSHKERDEANDYSTVPPKSKTDSTPSTKSEYTGNNWVVSLLYTIMALIGHLLGIVIGLIPLGLVIFVIYAFVTGNIAYYWDTATDWISDSYNSIVTDITKDKALENPESPEGVAATYIHSIKMQDKSAAFGTLKNEDLTKHTALIFDIYNGDELITKIFNKNIFTVLSGFNYRVHEPEYVNDTVKVNVTVKVVDLQKVVLSAIVKMTGKIERLSGDDLVLYYINSYDQENKMFLFPDIGEEAFDEAFDKSKSKIENDIVFTLKNEDGKWVIIDVDDPELLFDTLTGNSRYILDSEELNKLLFKIKQMN